MSPEPTATPSTSAGAHRQLWSLAWPMIIANLSIPLLGIVDTAILGHLPDPRHLSAVAIGSSLLALIYWGFGFLRMGTTGASAQAEGDTEQAALLLKALSLIPLIGLLIVLSQPLWLTPALTLMNTPDTLSNLASDYLQLRLLGVFAVLGNYVAVGWLIGQQRTRWPLAIAVTANLLNLLLDVIFIIGLDMGSRGAAIASVISEHLGLALALYVLRSPLSTAIKLGWHAAISLGQPLSQFLQQNLHLLVRTTALLFSLSFFTAQGAAQGEAVVAANSILLQLALAAAYGMDGFAHAAEALAGRAFRRRQRQPFLQICRSCGLWSLLTAALASVGLWLLQRPIIDTMTDIPAVVAIASEYYPYLIVMPLLSVASYTLDGIFIGALKTRAMQWSMLFSVFCVYLPLWYGLHSRYGNHALWWALLAFNTARGLSLGLALRRLLGSANWPSPTSPGAGQLP